MKESRKLIVYLVLFFGIAALAGLFYENTPKKPSEAHRSVSDTLYGKAWVRSYWEDEIDDMILNGFMAEGKFYIVKEGVVMEVPDILYFIEE